MSGEGIDTGATSPAPDASWDGELAFGTFVLAVATRTLTWTGEIFRIYGFEPSEVVPTLELLSAHQHPDDRDRSNARFQRLLTDGGPFCWYYRIIDARQVSRSVIATGEAIRDDGGAVTQVRGVFVDLTETLRRHQAAEVTRAVHQSAATRATIDQAKGVLMACFDLTDEQAFDLLRLHSSYANVKLRDVAATLVERLTDRDLTGMPARQRVASILNALANGRVPALPAPASTADPQWDKEPASGTREAAPHPSPRAAGAVALTPDFPLPTLVHAIDDAGLSITIADYRADDHPLVYVNQAFVDLTGYPAAEVLGRNCRFLQGADTERAGVAAMRSGLARGSDVRTVVRNYRRDGRPFWNELHLSPVRDDQGRLTHYIGYQVDVSERVEREQQLYQLAYYDAGSGLPNLAHALLHLESLIATASAIDVVYIGPPTAPAGRPAASTEQDASLTAVLGRRIGAALADNALVARLDGDALLVIQPNPRPGVGDELPAAIAELVIAPDGSGPPANRIGRSRYPDDAVSAADLIALAKADAG